MGEDEIMRLEVDAGELADATCEEVLEVLRQVIVNWPLRSERGYAMLGRCVEGLFAAAQR